VAFLQRDHDRVLVRSLDLLDPVEQEGRPVRVVDPPGAVQRELDILAGEFGAVLERDVLAQLERVGLTVIADLRLLGGQLRRRLGLAGCVTDQRRPDVVQNRTAVIVVTLCRIECLHRIGGTEDDAILTTATRTTARTRAEHQCHGRSTCDARSPERSAPERTVYSRSGHSRTSDCVCFPWIETHPMPGTQA